MPFGPNAPPGPRGIVIVGFDAELDPRAKAVIGVGGSDEAIVDNFNLSCPKWSPDGSKLAYMEDDKLQVATLGAQPPSEVCLSCTCSLLSDCRVDRFAWSPDGSLIAVSRPVGIALIPVDGGEWRPLPLKVPAGGTSISWSPDSTQLVVDGPALKVVGIDGTEDDLSPNGESPIWSPDGSRIAYLVWDRSQGTSTLVVSLPDGSARRELPVPDPHLPARNPVSSGDWRPGFATGIASVPIWSPDSRRLLYIAVGVDGYSLVSVSATVNAPPIFLTSFDSLLYNTGSSWLSWQPVFP
jgi:Tol biopolymer transport system component